MADVISNKFVVETTVTKLDQLLKLQDVLSNIVALTKGTQPSLTLKLDTKEFDRKLKERQTTSGGAAGTTSSGPSTRTSKSKQTDAEKEAERIRLRDLRASIQERYADHAETRRKTKQQQADFIQAETRAARDRRSTQISNIQAETRAARDRLAARNKDEANFFGAELRAQRDRNTKRKQVETNLIGAELRYQKQKDTELKDFSKVEARRLKENAAFEKKRSKQEADQSRVADKLLRASGGSASDINFAGFGGLNIKQQVASFNKVLQQNIRGLGTSTNTLQLLAAKRDQAIIPAQVEHFGQRYYQQAADLRGRRLALSRLLQVAQEQGLPGTDQFKPLLSQFHAARTAREAQEAAFIPVRRAETLVNLSTDENQRQVRTRYAQSQRSNLASRGITEESLKKASALEEELSGKLVNSAAAFNQQSLAVEKNISIFDHFTARFKALAIFSAAGAVLFTTTRAIANSISEIIGLESEIVRIQGILGRGTLGDKLTIERGVIDQARRYGLEIKEIVATIKEFAQAGFSLKESIRLSNQVQQAAIGGGLDVKQATETAISVENLTRGKTSAGDIFDRIAKVEAENAVAGQDLSLAIQRVGAIALQLQHKQVGAIDAFDTVLGSVTQIIESTRVSGNQAATTLRFVLARLGAPEITTKLQQQFGIKLADNPSGTSFRPLLDILHDLAKEFKQRVANNDTVGSTSLAVTLGGARQFSQTVALLEGFDKAIKVAEDSAFAFGDVERRTALQAETLQFKLGQLGNAFTLAVNTILEKTGLLSGAKAVAGFGTRVFTSIGESNLTGPIVKLIGSGIAAAVGAKAASSLFSKVKVSALGATGITAESGGLSKLIGFFGRASSVFSIGSIFKAGQGLGTIAKIFGVIGGLASGAFEVAGIVAGLLALIDIFRIITGFKSEATGLKKSIDFTPATIADVRKTQFGQHFQETADEFGLSTQDFVKTVSESFQDAKKELLSKGFSEKIFTGQATNPAFRDAFEKAFTTVLGGKLGGEFTKKLPGETDKEAFERQKGQALEILKNSTKYAGGSSQLSFEQLREQIQPKLDELQQSLLSGAIQQRLAAPTNFVRGFKGTAETGYVDTGAAKDAKGFYKVNTTSSEIGGVLKDSLGPFGEFIGELEKFTVVSNKTHKPINIMQAAIEEMTKGAATAGEALNKAYDEYFSSDAVKRQLGTRIHTYLHEYTKSTSVQEADIDNIGKGTSGPNKFIKAIIDSFVDETNKILKETKGKISPAIKELASGLSVLQNSDNAQRFLAQLPLWIKGLTLARDRVVDVLVQFTKQMDELATSGPIFRAAGVPQDVGRERQSALEGLIRGLGGAQASIRGDLLKAQLKLSGNNSLTDLIPYLPGQTDEEGGVAGRIPATAQGAFDKVKRISIEKLTEKDRASLKEQISEAQQALLAFSQNKDLFGKLDDGAKKSFLDYVAKFLGGGDEKEALVDRLKDLQGILKISGDQLKLEFATSQEIESQVTLLKQKADLVNQIADIQQQYLNTQNERNIRRAELLGTSGAGLSYARGGVARERQASIDKAQREFETGKTELLLELKKSNITTESPVYKNRIAALETELAGKTEIADLAAAIKDQNLVTAERDKINEQFVSSTKAAIESGSSGLREAFSSFQSLTSGDLIRRILDPAANAITSGFNDALQATLFGPNGLLTKQTGDLLGGGAKLNAARQEAELQGSILSNSHFTAIKRGADYFADRFTEAVARFAPAATPGPPGVSTSSGVTASSNYGGITTGGALLPFTESIPVTAAGFLAAYKRDKGNQVPGGSLPFNVPGQTANYNNIAGTFAGAAAAGGQGLTTKAKFTNLKNAALPLIGAYGGAAIGGAVGGKGKNSYASEGAAIGSGVGSIFSPVGGLIGGFIGGTLGGLFGKKDKTPPELSILEKIERGQRATITAIENQTRQLLSVDNRFLNVPSSFTLTNYRPINAGTGNTAVNGPGSTTSPLVIHVDARGSTSPQQVEEAAARGISRGLRGRGTFVNTHY